MCVSVSMNESRDKQSALDVSRVKIHPLIGIARQGLNKLIFVITSNLIRIGQNSPINWDC